MLNNQNNGFSSLLVFLIYNYNLNKDSIKEIIKLLKINKDKTEFKVLNAEFVFEFLNKLAEDDFSKTVKEIIISKEKHFDRCYSDVLAKLKSTI